MEAKKPIIFIFIFSLSALLVNAQSQKTIDSLEEIYQKCVDQGADMLGCTYQYYEQMDSILNVVYERLYRNLKSVQQARLRTEQRRWLTKRDLKFKGTEKELQNKFDAGIGGTDEEMLVRYGQAQYARERAEALLKKLKTKKHERTTHASQNTGGSPSAEQTNSI